MKERYQKSCSLIFHISTAPDLKKNGVTGSPTYMNLPDIYHFLRLYYYWLAMYLDLLFHGIRLNRMVNSPWYVYHITFNSYTERTYLGLFINQAQCWYEEIYLGLFVISNSILVRINLSWFVYYIRPNTYMDTSILVCLSY